MVNASENFYSITVRDGERMYKFAVAKDLVLDTDWSRHLQKAISEINAKR